MIDDFFDEILFVTGAALIVFAFGMLRRTRKFIADCGTAEGRIARYTTDESDEGIHHYAFIRFRDRSGVEHEVPGSHGLQEPPQIGTEVSITYHPADPSNAWVTGSASPWVIPWLVLIVGVAIVIGGFVVRAES